MRLIMYAGFVSLLCLILWLPNVTSNTGLLGETYKIGQRFNPKVFINQPISGIDLKSGCKTGLSDNFVGLSVTTVSKEAFAKGYGAYAGSANIQDIYHCAAGEPVNPTCSKSVFWKPLGTTDDASFRDVIVSARVFISNPADRETFGIVFTRPDGTTFGGGIATFYSSYNGRNNCFVFSDGSLLCDFSGVLINDFFFLSQCRPTGQWRADLVQGQLGSSLNVVGTKSFNLLAELEKPLIAFDQKIYPQQYGNFCHDPNDLLIEFPCGDPNHALQDVTTIAQFGCTITAFSTALNYYGVPATPDDLNNYLTSNGGYDQRSGEIRFGILRNYPFTKGLPGAITSIKRVDTSDTSIMRNTVCKYGPVLARVNKDTHTLTTYGFDVDAFGALNPKFVDPNGGRKTVFVPQIYDGIDFIIMLAGAEFNFSRRQLTFSFFSPVEVFITDPLGRRKGIDPRTNVAYNEITDAFYREAGTVGPVTGLNYHPPKVLEIYDPVDGEYTLTVVGTGNGQYRANFEGYDNNGNPSITELPFISTASGVVHTYKINYSGVVGSQLQIAANFDGGGQRPRDVNKLLSYLSPGVTTTSLPAGTTTTSLIIIYGKDIVPNTFRAELNGVDITASFAPKPGEIQTINVPLQSGSNVLKLSVDGQIGNRVATDSDRLVFKVE